MGERWVDNDLVFATRYGTELDAANSWPQTLRVPCMSRFGEVNHLVLVRSDATAGHDQLLDAAICRPPAADQPARGLELKITALGTAARNTEVDQISADQAGYLAARLRGAVADLTRLSRNLERRTQRRWTLSSGGL
jgi:hypothetical protein